MPKTSGTAALRDLIIHGFGYHHEIVDSSSSPPTHCWGSPFPSPFPDLAPWHLTLSPSAGSVFSLGLFSQQGKEVLHTDSSKSAMKTKKQTDCKKHLTLCSCPNSGPSPVVSRQNLWAPPRRPHVSFRVRGPWCTGSSRCPWPLLLNLPLAPVAVCPHPSRETSHSTGLSWLALTPCLLKH